MAQVEGQGGVLQAFSRIVGLLDDGAIGPQHNIRQQGGLAKVGQQATHALQQERKKARVGGKRVLRVYSEPMPLLMSSCG